MKSSLFFFLLSFVLTSCTSPSPQQKQEWQSFAARDDGQSLQRPLLYRTIVPENWIRKDPDPHTSIVDTMKPICEFSIAEGDQTIRLTIHTFPISKEVLSIPPQAQVARWKEQFEELDLITTHTTPVAHGGFSGLFFEGEGILKDQNTQVLGWSMRLSPLYGRQLEHSHEPIEKKKYADYTIKASGPADLMKKHRNDILSFANHFELIDELPIPS